MKKHTLLYICSLLIIVASSIMPAQAQQSEGQYALYNYCNNGDFHAWLNIDIDSITYSRVDMFGVEHDDVVVQEVWTPDSVYRIPLEVIDSIGFRVPDPVIKSDVFHITEDHIPYIEEKESLTITFSTSIPENMLPKKGQVIISDVYGRFPMESGFAGRVKNIIRSNNVIRMECEEASLEDVYNQIICVGRTESFLVDDSASGTYRKISIHKDGTVSIPLGKITVPLKDPTLESSGNSINLNISPSISADYTIIYNVKGLDNRFKFILKPQLDFSMDYKIKLKLFNQSSDNKTSFLKEFIPIETGIPGVYAKLKWGVFFDYSGDISIDGKLSYKSQLNVGYDSGKESYYGFVFNNDGSGWDEPDVSLSVNGSVSMGPAFQLVACIVSEDWFPSVSITAMPGPELSGKFEINDDMFTGEGISVYEALKDTKITLAGKLKVEGNANIFGSDYSLPSYTLSPDWLKKDLYLFPKFTEPTLLDISEIGGQEGYSPTALYSEISRDLFWPLKVGIGVYHMDGSVDEYYDDKSYMLESSWIYPNQKKRKVGVDMKKYLSGNTYYLCPIFCSFIGKEDATPKTTFTVPQTFILDSNVLTLQKNTTQLIGINKGWGNYSAFVNNKSVCGAEIKQIGNRQFVQVVGLSKGSTVITIRDLRSNEIQSLLVTITEDPVSKTTISVSHTEIDFGTVSQGGTMKKRFKVTNDGESSITIQASCESSDFELSDNNTKVTLAKGESKDYIVTCNGLSITDDVNAVIIITSDGSSESQSITLKAKCGSATTSNIAVSPTEIDFGSVEYGTTKTRELKVSNTGDKSLTFHVSYQGSKTIFVSDNGKEYTLNPGDYKIYTVTCQGMLQDVNATGEIKVVTTADNGNQIVKLTAQGAAPTTFTLEKNSTEIKAGSVGYVNILYGSNNYSISNGNNEVVSVVIDTDNGDYGRVKLVGIDPGQSMVKLTDQKTKKTVNLSVVVKEDDSPYITFVDAEVEKVCLSHWDANGDGRLSKTEAAAVKDLNGAFMYNYDIYSFPEFRYFTGIDILNLDFYNCHQLQDIVLPVNLKNIYWNTFYDCGKLRSIHIPQNVSYINNLAFQWSNGLETVTVSTKNVKYDSRENCNAIIESETNTLNNGFYTTIVPPTVTAIGSNAFWGQDRLEELSLPSSITEIGEGAFGFCDLREVTIPSSVVNIGGGLFGGCYNLKSITVAPGNSVYDSREGSNAIINSHTNELMQGCQNTTIPSSVTSIAAYAFQWQYRLKNITIPEGVKSIGRYAFYNCDELDNIYIPASVSYIGSGAFGCCTDLSEVVVSSQNPTYDSRNQSNAIVETATNTLMHANRYTLISDDITSVADDALAGYNAYSLTLPEGITYIGNQAFRGCRLESLKLPSTLKDLGSAVFWECEDLTDVVCYAKDVPYVDGFDHGDWTFHVSNATLHVPAGSVDSYRNAPYWQDFGNIVALPKSTIKVEPIENDFGTVPNGKSKTMYFTVTNTGEEIVFFHLDFNNNDMFEVSDVGTEYLLKAGESKSFTITCYGLKAGTSASVRVSIESDALNATDFSVVDIFANGEPISYTPSQPVDLGLPSGTLWASYNLGASAPEDFGYYYAWGETEERSVYSEENYLYKGQDIGSDISGTAYDVVTQKWGNGWQMPTSAQFSELEDKCTWEWTTQNGINGQKVTGPNGNSIFLPAVGSGYYDGEGVGSTGYYWTSTVYDSTLAYDFIYYMDFLSYVGKHDRYNAHAVRPVMSIQVKKEISVTPTEIDFGTMTEGTSETEYITVSNVGSGTINFHFDYTSDFITVSGGDKENIVLEARQSHTFPVVCTIPKNCQSLGESVTIYIRSDADNEKEVAVKASVTIKPGSDTELDALMKELVNDMVTVEGGTFTMGATDGSGYEDERPTHQVTLSTYKICRYEVTQKLWTAIMGNNPSTFIDDDLPVNNVSWDECQTFISKLNELACDYCDDLFCLPTEAQWEYAARGGVLRNDLSGDYGNQYAGGYNYIEEMDSYVWYSDNSNGTTHSVGTKKPNELGLYDMSGNVCEYVKDYFSWNTYTEEAQQNPTGAESGDSRVYRGGSYDRPSWQCRLASRFGNEPDNKRVECGLRLASDVGEDYIGVGDGTTGGKQDDWKDGDPVVAEPGDESISVSGGGRDF